MWIACEDEAEEVLPHLEPFWTVCLLLLGAGSDEPERGSIVSPAAALMLLRVARTPAETNSVILGKLRQGGSQACFVPRARVPGIEPRSPLPRRLLQVPWSCGAAVDASPGR